jgi:hypothetical protein
VSDVIQYSTHCSSAYQNRRTTNPHRTSSCGTMANQYRLKWNNYQLSLTTAFKHILEAEDFVDVTLSAESQNLKAHRVVLSACSSYFRVLLKCISPWQHPVLVLKDVPFLDLQSVLEFVYLGRCFYTDKKDNQIYLIYKGIQKDWVQSHI